MKDITKSRKSWRVDLNPKIFIFPRIKAKQISCHIPPSRICFLHSTAPTSGQKAQRKWAGRCTGSLWSTHPARFGIRKAIKPTQPQGSSRLWPDTEVRQCWAMQGWHQPQEGQAPGSWWWPGFLTWHLAGFPGESSLLSPPAQLPSMNILTLIKNTLPLPCTPDFVGLPEECGQLPDFCKELQETQI